MRRSAVVAGRWAVVSLVVVGFPTIARAVTPGLVQTFASGTGGWTGGTPTSNPGTGGVGGAGDGYLHLASAFPNNFGTQNTTPDYTGNWDAAGITHVSFFLNDVGAAEAFSFHFLLTSGGSFGTTWQHNAQLAPPNGQWQQYVVDLSNEAEWTRTRGTMSLAQVRQNVTHAHFRHDLPPYTDVPDAMTGDIGIDSIALVVPEPAALGLLAASSVLLLRRRR